MRNPLVSILMPVYNSYDHVRSEGKNLLEIALKSILNQTYQKFELIILDNQSTDRTPEVCKKYAKKDNRIKYIRDTRKRFPEGAITHLASFAKGKYCMIANDDDTWDKKFISTVINYLKKNPSTDLCYSNGQYIDIKGNKLNQLVPNDKYIYSGQKSGYSYFLKFLYLRNIIPIANGIYRIKAFRKALPFHQFDNLKANVDNLFMIKLLLQNQNIHFIDKNLFYYRTKERALDPSKVSDMPPLTHPVDIWNYYAIHQINLYKEISKLVNKNISNDFYKIFANIQALKSCVYAAVNLLSWIRDDVAHNFSDKEKFFMAESIWKHRNNKQLAPIYERVQLDYSMKLYGQSPIIIEEINNLLEDLKVLRRLVGKLNYQNDYKYLSLRMKLLDFIETEINRLLNEARKIEADSKTSKIIHSIPKRMNNYKKCPRVSVIVTSYNLRKFLKPTLFSILNQNFENYEIIVIDGKSTDGSIKELKKMEKNFPKLHCFSEKDNGYSDALWKGIRMARGEYIMQCAVSDAYANPDWLAICAKTLDINKDISLVWGFPQYIDEQGKAGKISFPQFHTKIAPSEKEFYKYWIRTGFFFPEGNFCVRKRVLTKCYPALNEIKPLTLDWLEFTYRFNRYGYLSKHIPIVANYGRRHRSQMGISMEKSGRLKKMSIYYFGKIAIYRLLLLIGVVKHKFVDQYSHSIRDEKREMLHFSPLRGQLHLLIISKLKRHLRQMLMFSMYTIKQVI